MRSAQIFRRLQLGWASYFLVDGISMVGLSVWAFRHGGTPSVGVVGLARLLPGAIALPFGAWAADRYSRRKVVSVVFLAVTARAGCYRRGTCGFSTSGRDLCACRVQQRGRYAVPPSSPGPRSPRRPLAHRVGRDERHGRNAGRTRHIPRPSARSTVAARRRTVVRHCRLRGRGSRRAACGGRHRHRHRSVKGGASGTRPPARCVDGRIDGVA